jgi:chromosomal replication initiation ATPase DnaA
MTDIQSIHDEQSFRAACAPTRGGQARRIAARAYGVPMEEIAAATRRSPRAALARQVAMYLAHVVLGMTLSEVAGEFRRDRTTASHACRRVEDLREDPDLDRLLEWLETQLRAAAP